jgi:signal transduction histidine kinase
MTIRNKLYLSVILGFIVFGVVMALYLTINFKRNFIVQRKIYGMGILEGFISDLNFGITISNKDYLKKICKKIININFINSIKIYKNNHFLIEVKKSDYNNNNLCIIEKKVKLPSIRYSNNNSEKNSINSPDFAKYILRVDLKDSKQFLKKYLVNISAIIIASIIIIFFLIGFFIKRFLEPISRLSEFVEKMKKFEFTKINEKYPPELIPLVNTFNEFVDEISEKTKKINEKIKELENTNKNLEEKINEIKALQKILINNEKLVSIGTMAASIAHEINNPLSCIMGIAELQLYADKKTKDTKIYKKIIDNCHRMSYIVKKLKGYSSISNKRKKFLLKDIIEDAIDILSQSMKLDFMSIKGNFKDSDLYIYCNKNEIIQVLTNLIENSSHACNGKGIITIDLFEQGENITILFCDSGHGIDKNIKNKIFKSFFTTKKDVGTGLGLYICHKIITEHNGTIKLIDNKKNKGACFKITLPKPRV